MLAWLTTIANVAEVDLAEAVYRKYGQGCPGCGQFVCRCDDSGNPDDRPTPLVVRSVRGISPAIHGEGCASYAGEWVRTDVSHRMVVFAP